MPRAPAAAPARAPPAITGRQVRHKAKGKRRQSRRQQSSWEFRGVQRGIFGLARKVPQDSPSCNKSTELLGYFPPSKP